MIRWLRRKLMFLALIGAGLAEGTFRIVQTGTGVEVRPRSNGLADSPRVHFHRARNPAVPCR